MRPKIKEWLAQVDGKKFQDWLVIHVDVEEYQKGRKFNFFTMYDKLKSDYNIKK